MPLVSIVIPTRNEQFLRQTTEDLLAKSRGDIEIIICMDGYDPEKDEKSVVDDRRVQYIEKPEAEGMRSGINSCVFEANGDYILKIDGHCLLDDGYDIKLVKDSQPDWVVIPRRKRLDAENWCVQDCGKPDVDYEFLSFPDNPSDFGGKGLNGRIWTQRIVDRMSNNAYDIDENMSFQGSCWFMPRALFDELELMDDKMWGTFWSEAQEIGLRAWLSGKKVMTNKKTWYAHLHKGRKYGRGYHLDGKQLNVGSKQNMRFFAGEKMWKNQIHPLSWLIERLMPIPGWTQEEVDRLKERERLHWG